MRLAAFDSLAPSRGIGECSRKNLHELSGLE